MAKYDLYFPDAMYQILRKVNCFLVSTPEFTIMISTLLNGIITESLGPKKSLILAQCIIVTGWVILYFAPNYPILLGGRGFMGIGVGIVYPTALMYLSEIALVCT